ncbi:MAG: nucleotide exchange factor GrpE [Candidatus Omnitrophica bacterium]|nr:nucleotide exchange factor GrpE [Candidatus Omnitrophota bacterium]
METEKTGEQKEAPSEEAQKPLEEKMIKVKETEYAKLVEERARYKDQYIRLYAEFENARKRMEREKQEFIKFANEGLIIEFLSILDNLERSVEAAKAKHQDYTAFLKGIEMVMAHVHEMLKNNGVAAVEAQGKMFDPHCHEVLLQEETDQMEDGMIMQELQKGYSLGGKVIRTAKVKVARKKEQNS